MKKAMLGVCLCYPPLEGVRVFWREEAKDLKIERMKMQV